MSQNEYVPTNRHLRASWAGFCANLRGLAVPLLLAALAVWPLLLLWGAIVAAQWAAELACGWEATWLRC